MKKNSAILFFLIVIFLISSCALAANRADSRMDHEIWAGVYSGIIPAADGPGIDVLLTLNADKTYELRYSYIDRGEATWVLTGNLRWDAATRIITLDIDNFPSYYKVGDQILTQLDLDRRVITGELAGNYTLRKISH